MTRIVTGAGYGVEMLGFLEGLSEDFDGSVSNGTSTSFVVDLGEGFSLNVQGTGFDIYLGDNPPLTGTITGLTIKDGADNVAVITEFSITIAQLANFIVTDDGEGFRDALLGGADWIYGAGDDDVLRGYGGVDKLYGGEGNDVYYIETAGDKAYEDAGEGTDAVISSVSYSLSGQYIESLTLTGSGNINATGNTLVNLLTGNRGNNTLDGGAGIDTMAGGAGNDTYKVDSQRDVVVEAKGAGTDTVLSSVTYTLAAGVYVENLTLTGSAKINGTGNGIDNVLTGNSGTNVLTGGKGNDTYYVQNTADTVIEKKGEGTDHVFSTVNFSLKGQYIEYLTLTGSANVYAKGNTLDNRLVGNSGNNKINGMEGQDRLTGGRGSDTFIWDATSHSKVNDSDRITDLSNSDFIDLSRIDANVNASGTQHFVLVDAFTNTAGQVTLTFDGTYTNLNADTNGDGISDMLVRIDGDHEDFDNFIFGG